LSARERETEAAHPVCRGRHCLFAEILVAGSVKASDADVELTIRQVIPVPFRCFRTLNRCFFAGMRIRPATAWIFDFSSSLDGASASLTYNFDDRKRHELLGSMRNVFLGLRISAEAYDDCLSTAEWQRGSILVPNFRVLRHRIELGDRVTYEIFAIFSNKSPKIVYAAESAS
jgi:hypothetical protein